MKLILPSKIIAQFIMKPVPPWKITAHLHQTKLTNTLSPIFGSMIQGAELIEVQIQVLDIRTPLPSVQIRELRKLLISLLTMAVAADPQQPQTNHEDNILELSGTWIPLDKESFGESL